MSSHKLTECGHFMRLNIILYRFPPTKILFMSFIRLSTEKLGERIFRQLCSAIPSVRPAAKDCALPKRRSKIPSQSVELIGFSINLMLFQSLKSTKKVHFKSGPKGPSGPQFVPDLRTCFWLVFVLVNSTKFYITSRRFHHQSGRCHS